LAQVVKTDPLALVSSFEDANGAGCHPSRKAQQVIEFIAMTTSCEHFLYQA
jgi:hypothetical protein